MVGYERQRDRFFVSGKETELKRWRQWGTGWGECSLPLGVMMIDVQAGAAAKAQVWVHGLCWCPCFLLPPKAENIRVHCPSLAAAFPRKFYTMPGHHNRTDLVQGWESWFWGDDRGRAGSSHLDCLPCGDMGEGKMPYPPTPSLPAANEEGDPGLTSYSFWLHGHVLSIRAS